MQRGATRVHSKTTSVESTMSWRKYVPMVLIGLMLVVVLALLGIAYVRYTHNAHWHIERVRIEGDLHQLSNDALIDAMALPENASLLSLDLEQLRQRVLFLPWVKSVAIRRVFPSELALQVSEREPNLRMNDDALIDRDGQVFHPENLAAFAQLPLIETTKANLALALIQYTVANEALRPLGLAVVDVQLSPRRALQLELNNHVKLMFGREDWESRLKRVVALYPGLAASGKIPVYVDVRYDTGFAVAWPKELKPDSATRTAGL